MYKLVTVLIPRLEMRVMVMVMIMLDSMKETVLKIKIFWKKFRVIILRIRMCFHLMSQVQAIKCLLNLNLMNGGEVEDLKQRFMLS